MSNILALIAVGVFALGLLFGFQFVLYACFLMLAATFLELQKQRGG